MFVYLLKSKNKFNWGYQFNIYTSNRNSISESLNNFKISDELIPLLSSIQVMVIFPHRKDFPPINSRYDILWSRVPFLGTIGYDYYNIQNRLQRKLKSKQH